MKTTQISLSRQYAIRLAACLLIAAASAPAFGDAGDRTSDSHSYAMSDEATKRDTTSKTADTAGSGSGEPQSAAARDRTDTTADAARASKHRAFLEQVWAMP